MIFSVRNGSTCASCWQSGVVTDHGSLNAARNSTLPVSRMLPSTSDSGSAEGGGVSGKRFGIAEIVCAAPDA